MRTAANVFLTVRRIGQNQIKLLSSRRHLSQCGKGILHPDLHVFGWETCELKILPQHFGVTIGLFYTHSRGSATAQTFEAERAGAGGDLQQPRRYKTAAPTVE